MTHRFSARLHVWLVLSIAAVAGRLRFAPQRGQGTVEYVALILLVAGVLAVAVTAAGASGKNLKFGEIITTELKEAIKTVSK
jgi:hypothetical protein